MQEGNDTKLRQAKWIGKYGNKIFFIFFGFSLGGALFFTSIYDEYTDSFDMVLRDDPVWLLFGFGIFIVIAGIFAIDESHHIKSNRGGGNI